MRVLIGLSHSVRLALGPIGHGTRSDFLIIVLGTGVFSRGLSMQDEFRSKQLRHLRLLQILVAIDCYFFQPNTSFGEQDRNQKITHISGEVIEISADDIDAEKILRNPERIEWTRLNYAEALISRANHRFIYKIIVPSDLAEDQILRVPFSNCSGRSPSFIAYAKIGDELKKLEPIREHVCAFYVPRTLSKKELYGLWTKQHWNSFGSFSNIFIAKSEHVNYVRREAIFTGFISGIIIIMVIYNFGMIFLFRKLYLFFYLVYAASYLTIFLGAMSMYTPGDHLPVFYLANAIFPTAMICFSMQVLGIDRSKKSTFMTGISLIVINALIYILWLFDNEFVTKNFLATGPLQFLFCFSLAARASYNGYKPAYAMLLGWSGIFIAMVLLFLQYSNVGFPDMLWALPIAVTFEIATFSFAIGQKLRISELQFMRENEHAFNQMKKMVYPHQLSRIRSGEDLELTMPTTTAQACVISFDIVGSSKIQHVNAKNFFRNTFTRCNEIISEGYDGRSLKANAYRIKEMGDGFLCSVGYPFEAMSDNIAHDAVDLARKFAEILMEEAKMLHSDSPIACGIGIALDTITGFYPEAGTKEYDLYGQALILATRYEGMRKILCPESQRSVLILQEKVYKSLNPSRRKGFVELNLKQQGIVVRDDSAATHIYYQFLSEQQEKADVPPNHLQIV